MVGDFRTFLSFLLLLLIADGAMAQFSPGKRSGESAALEYRKMRGGDSLKVRKSKLEPKRKKRGVMSEGVKVRRSPSVEGSVSRKSSSTGKKRRSVPEVDSLFFEPVAYRLGDRVIMRGDSGKDVRSVAKILVKKLYIGEDSIIYTKDGGVLYDGDLVRAVKHFQEFNGMYPDGIIGTEVVKALRRRK